MSQAHAPLIVSYMAAPGYILFRPWSHTNKRHVLKLVGLPQEKKKHLDQAVRLYGDPKAQRAFLEPIETITLEGAIKSDKKRIKHALKVGAEGLTSDALRTEVQSFFSQSG